jgi:hypothetical protein
MSECGYLHYPQAPEFRQGYEEHFWGRESTIDASWSPDERALYDRGRLFGQFVQEYEGQRIRLTRGGMPLARISALLIMCFGKKERAA